MTNQEIDSFAQEWLRDFCNQNSVQRSARTGNDYKLAICLKTLRDKIATEIRSERSKTEFGKIAKISLNDGIKAWKG